MDGYNLVSPTKTFRIYLNSSSHYNYQIIILKYIYIYIYHKGGRDTALEAEAQLYSDNID